MTGRKAGRPLGPKRVQMSVRIPADLESRIRGMVETYEDRPMVWVVCDLLKRGIADRERELREGQRSKKR